MSAQIIDSILHRYNLGQNSLDIWPFIWRCFLPELLAREERARGRRPIAKVIYPSQKIW